MSITVTPFKTGIGADVSGVDLSAISEADVQAIKDAWIAHQVLRFRGQKLDDDALRDELKGLGYTGGGHRHLQHQDWRRSHRRSGRW